MPFDNSGMVEAPFAMNCSSSRLGTEGFRLMFLIYFIMSLAITKIFLLQRYSFLSLVQ